MKTDGYLPNCKVFVYVLPLIVTASIIYGFLMDYGHGTTTDEDVKAISSPVILQLRKDVDLKVIEETVDTIIEKFNLQLTALVEKRLDYIEWEIEQTS